MSDVWDCPGWLSDVRDRQQDFPIGEKCCIMCVEVIEPWANVRGTGRYENISVRKKKNYILNLRSRTQSPQFSCLLKNTRTILSRATKGKQQSPTERK